MREAHCISSTSHSLLTVGCCHGAHADIEPFLPPGENSEQPTILIRTDTQTAASVPESSGPLGKLGGLQEGKTGKAKTAAGAPALDKSPDHAEGKSFKEQANRLMYPGDLLSFLSISSALITNEYSFLNL